MLRTVGVGTHRGGTLAELLDNLLRVQERYGIPGSATVARTGSGSIHALELIWDDEKEAPHVR